MSARPMANRGEFTGRHMWLLALGFFGVIIAVNIGMAVVASTSWTGLVVENSYVASQEFEEKRIAHEAQQAAGWQESFTHSAGVARVLVTDRGGQPIDLGTVTLQLNRPVGGQDDQNVVLERNADGSYQAHVTLDAGVWEALVTAPATAKGFFELHERFNVAGTTR